MTSGAGDKAEGRRTAAKIAAWVVGIVAGAVPVLVIVGVAAFVFTYVTVVVPAPGDIKQNQVATIVDSKGGVLARVVPPEGNRTDVKYENIPTSMVAAIKAAEDRDFDSNVGFSLRGFSRAALGKLTSDGGAGGGSTITQQYVKNAIVGDEVSYKRKFKELAIATKMSRQWSKEEIMAAYLNTIYFGRGAYGIAAAAKAYFNRDITKVTPEQCADSKLPRAKRANCLSASESALLAGIVRGPSLYDPAVNPEMATERWNYVLDGMVDIGFLQKADRDTQKFPKIAAVKAADSSDVKSGPNGLIERKVLAELDTLDITEQDVRTGGLTITTSIRPQVQNALVSQARSVMTGEPKELRTASVSIDPATGGIVGYFGGNDGQGWDYASAGLQTGSVFKVFALVAGLEQDIPLSQRYDSSPYVGPGGITINNSDGESCGTCNLATATKMSLNTVFYRLMMDLNGGPQAVADTAHRLGIAESFGDIEHTLSEPNGKPENGIVLGQYPTRVLDMASAYATLAASGIYREPYLVQKVETSTGDVLFDREANKGKRVVSAAVADNVSAALSPIAAYSNGNALYDSTYGARPSAAKTGTAQLGDTGENKDAWMVGYTPQLSTAVWVGTNKGTALRNSYGGTIYGSGLPAQIWRAQMNAALEGVPVEQFPDPEPVGGQAGVPYEPPPTTYTPTETSRQRSRPRLPGEGDDGNITILPGVTIPGGNNDNGNSGDNGDNGGDGDVTLGPGDGASTGTRSRGN
ncbi:Membrane carboxypeptidase (penicillin-binding protein) [Gordonia malaquae]|uniref:Putative penicillin-binding protein n=1 Tax=Gordonia malaquae NBRC 108250 TaxID=1223542 RepID=M3TFZ0_GORML|nr:transglycosylase domain-containing protein [Gordonia malaquae]GAC80366.1 putative penicillin-binding protein [Gordonia malaquae NBRC 108250]SEB53253.1 Membrane carboxypeptidase (penicillin-binding protein) [Gordonia malaquae]